MMLMPSGMTPEARPWSARPTIIQRTSESLRAQTTTEPLTSSTMLTISIRRLPYMSAEPPITGVATAAASSVAVTAQAVSTTRARRAARAAPGRWG